MANWNLPATLPLDKSERMKDEFSGRTYLEATIIEGLKFKTSFNFDLINYNTLVIRIRKSVRLWKTEVVPAA